MANVKVTAKIDVELETRDEATAKAALVRMQGIASFLEQGSMGSSMTGVIPGSAKVHVSEKTIEGKPTS
jgi:hypothetical protein